MTRTASIFSLLLMLLLLCVCSTGQHVQQESVPASTEEVDASAEFDPLELPADRTVVPMKYPREGYDIGAGTESGDSTVVVTPLPTVDSANNQTYRIQLFTSKLYGEAKTAVKVAEEIFDQPLFVDYEVPYFKVRVGGFASRELAEKYQQKARTAGYENAWVVLVNLNAEKAESLYDNLPSLVPPDSTVSDSVGSGPEHEDDE